MQDTTKEMMLQMVEFAREGNEIIPMFWQPRRGADNTVSAAIRAALARNLLEQNGVDGLGKPVYAAVIPGATHAGTETIQ